MTAVNALLYRFRWALMLAAMLTAALTLSPIAAHADADGNDVSTNDLEYLPLFRWSDASSQMHIRVSQGDFMDSVKSLAKERIAGSFMMFGNFCFTLATSIVRIAVEFDALDTAGKEVDSTFATIGQAVIDSPIFALIIAIVIGVALWAAHKQSHGKPLMTMLGKPIILIAVFAVLVGGATATGDASQPAKGSPWWVGNTVNSIVTSVASAPVSSLQVADMGFKLDLNPNATSNPGDPKSDPLSCEAYLDSMKKKYSTEKGDAAQRMNRSITLSLSNMWEATALRSYIDAQFGRQLKDDESGGNVYGDRVFCRMLEMNSAQKPDDQIALMDGIEIQDTDEAQRSSAFRQYGSAEVDVSVMYWAACRWDGSKFTVDENWAKADGGDGEKLGDSSDKVSCSKWWDYPPKTADKDSEFNGDKDSPVNFVGDRQEVEEQLKGTGAGIGDFVMATQGWQSTDAAITSVVFAVSSFLVSLAFGVLAIIILGAKLGMIVMLMLLGIALIFDMLPSSTGGKLKQYSMSYLGMAFIAFGVQLIFAIIVLMTSVIADIGSSFTGSGVIRNVWLGLAPLIAFVLMHLFFTKFLKAPSPFTPSGAMGWMKGAAGGALVGRGLSSLSNMRNRSRDSDGGRQLGGSGASTGPQRNDDGSTETGTEDKMKPMGSKAAGASGGDPGAGKAGLEDGAGAGAGVGAAKGATGDADGLNTGGDGAAGVAGDKSEDGLEGGAEPKGKVEGKGAKVSGVSANLGKNAGKAGLEGSAAPKSGIPALSSRFDDLKAKNKAIKEGKQAKRNAHADALDNRIKKNKAAHLAGGKKMTSGSLAAQIGNKAQRLGSAASTMGKNSVLSARSKVARSGGYRAAAGRYLAQEGKQTGRGMLATANWVRKNAGKAGMVTAGAAGLAVAAPVIAPGIVAGGIGMAAAGVATGAGLKATANLAVGGVKSGYRGIKGGYRNSAQQTAAGARGLARLTKRKAASGYRDLYARAHDRAATRKAEANQTITRRPRR